MEVIRHGNTYKEVECKECGALLSCCERDIKSYEGLLPRIYNNVLYYIETFYVVCPECNNKIEL